MCIASFPLPCDKGKEWGILGIERVTVVRRTSERMSLRHRKCARERCDKIERRREDQYSSISICPTQVSALPAKEEHREDSRTCTRRDADVEGSDRRD